MAVPKKKTSKSRTGSRKAANTKLAGLNLIACSNCKELKRAHNVCPSCGMYRGKKILEVK